MTYLDTSILVTYSDDLPVTLEEAKAHLRVTHSSEDDLIETYIFAAARIIEESNQIALLPATVTQQFDRIPENGSYVDLSYPAIELTTISYNTIEAPASYASMSGAVIDIGFNRPRIYAPDGWPSGWMLKVVYECGYATPEAIPKPLKIAVLLTLSDLYENRTDSVKAMPTAAELITRPYRTIPKI